MDDRQIIALYFDRCEDALKITSDKYDRFLRRISMNILANEEDVEECINDTYLAVWNSVPPAEPENFPAYIAALCRNISLNVLRKKRTVKRGGNMTDLFYEELSEVIPSGKDISDEVESIRIGEVIDEFLRSESEMRRNVFILRYWYFLPLDEISRKTGLTKAGIKTILFRMRAKLRRRLEKEEIYV